LDKHKQGIPPAPVLLRKKYCSAKDVTRRNLFEKCMKKFTQRFRKKTPIKSDLK